LQKDPHPKSNSKTNL